MYTDIKTFDDACKHQNIKADSVPDFSGFPEKHRKALIALTQLVVIASALNDNWQPNWNNDDEYKYYPWFDMKDGFVFDGVDSVYTYSDVGSRLCFKSRDIAKYAVDQFEDLYKDYFTYS